LHSELSASNQLLSKVYIDVTDLINYAQHNTAVSGIQRVIVKTITRFVNEHGLDRIELIALEPATGRLVCSDASLFLGDYVFDQLALCRHFNVSPASNKPSLKDYLRARYKNPISYAFHFCRMQLNNWLSGGRTFAKRNIADTVKAAPIDAASTRWRVAEPGQNDRVLILGATWDFPGFTEAFAKAKAKSPFRVYQLIHDLIPIVVPEHMGQGVPARFQKWFDEVLDVSDVILANSQATASDIYRYAEVTGRIAPKIRAVPLAHEYVLPAQQPDARVHVSVFNDRNLKLPRHATQRVLAATIEPYILVVGTLESRKNILRLVQVWKHIVHAEGPKTFNLVLAGKSTGLKGLQGMLAASGNVDGKAHLIERPDDAEIAFLYANCQFSVCLSYYEGWGLPIGECMWMGRPVLASNISSIPEVGGDLIDYCDPYDDVEIEAQMRRLIFDARHRERRAQALDRGEMRTWDQVISQIWEEVSA
jgi:glycosyltransferase involved in cell wall biosynthesis